MKLREIVNQIIKESFADDTLNKIKGDTHWYDILYYYLVKGGFYGDKWEKWNNLAPRIDSNILDKAQTYITDYAFRTNDIELDMWLDSKYPTEIKTPNTTIKFYVMYETTYADSEPDTLIPSLIQADF